MMVDMVLPLRVGLQQRIFPSYRSAFFDSLAAACGDGLSVFAGQPLPSESVQCGDHLEEACLVLERNIHYFAGRFYLYRQPALQDWLAKWNPQVLVAEVNPRNLSLPAAIRWMHRHNRRVIGWGLGAPANQGISSYLQHANWRRFIHQFDNLVTYSQKGAAEYITAGFEKTNIIVAPNAVAPRQRFPMPQRPQEFSTRPVVLFVGRLQDRKKVDNLIRACAALPPGLQPDVCCMTREQIDGFLVEDSDSHFLEDSQCGMVDLQDLRFIKKPEPGCAVIARCCVHRIPFSIRHRDLILAQRVR